MRRTVPRSWPASPRVVIPFAEVMFGEKDSDDDGDEEEKGDDDEGDDDGDVVRRRLGRRQCSFTRRCRRKGRRQIPVKRAILVVKALAVVFVGIVCQLSLGAVALLVAETVEGEAAAPGALALEPFEPFVTESASLRAKGRPLVPSIRTIWRAVANPFIFDADILTFGIPVGVATVELMVGIQAG